MFGGFLKKVTFVLLLGCLILGNVFTQEEFNSSKKFSVMVYFFPAIGGLFENSTGLGLFLETRINNYFSAVLEFDFYKSFSNNDLKLLVVGHGRIYPFKTTLEKAFYDFGIGYRNDKWKTDDITALVMSLSAGWKFVLGKGFVIEPNIGFWNNMVIFSGETENTHGPIAKINFGWTL